MPMNTPTWQHADIFIMPIHNMEAERNGPFLKKKNTLQFSRFQSVTFCIPAIKRMYGRLLAVDS